MQNAVLVVVLLAGSSVNAPTYVVPVVTARSDVLDHSSPPERWRAGPVLRSIYAVPNDPKGETLRASYTVPVGGGRPRVDEDVLLEGRAIGIMRLARN